jgi:glucose-1-phosphate thymidylyltransferase
MIYYPLSMLMLAGIREILVISTPEDLPACSAACWSDGSTVGHAISYAEQDQPRGLADAFRVGASFVGNQRSCLILGDNIFFGHGLPTILQRAAALTQGALIFAYPVRDPQRYGVVEFDEAGKGHEHRGETQSSRARTMPSRASTSMTSGRWSMPPACSLPRAGRSRSPISTAVTCTRVNCGSKCWAAAMPGWMPARTRSLLQASTFIQAVEDRQGMMISCPEEIAFFAGIYRQGTAWQLGREDERQCIWPVPGDAGEGKTMVKIVLFGKNGQVGWELQRILPSLGQVVAWITTSSTWPT